MIEYKKNKFGVIIPSKVTKSFRNFGLELEYHDFFLVYIKLAEIYINKHKEDAKKRLIELYSDEKNELANVLVDYLKNSDISHLFDSRTYEAFFGQMAFARTVDNFITYFKDLLAEVFNARPEILRSRDQEKLEFILKFDTMEELRNAIAEKKIDELFYKGISDIDKFFKEKLGIQLFKTEEDLNEANALVKKRNLIAHNRGRITKQFMKEFPNPDFKEGMYLKLSYEDLSKINLMLNNFLVYIDSEVSSKFGLELLENKY